MGAILKTRCPVSLNEATWMITDSASMTKTPPTIGSSSSCLMRMATVPSAPPSASDPTSPMKMSAGYELYQRNPRLAPTKDPQKIVNSAAGEKRTSSRYSASTRWPVTYASAVNAAAATAKQLIARPSSPSVRFTLLVDATSTSTANGTYPQLKSGMNPLK